MSGISRLLVIFGLFTVLLVEGFTCRPAYAVDIFNSCSSDKAAEQTQCNDCAGGAAKTSVCQEVNSQSGKSSNPIISGLKTAIIIVSYVVGAASIIGILASSLRLITSGGDANATASARNGIVYCLIGLLVTAFAQGIVVFVLDKLH